jgi:outer membrane protein assembly factor BamB
MKTLVKICSPMKSRFDSLIPARVSGSGRVTVPLWLGALLLSLSPGFAAETLVWTYTASGAIYGAPAIGSDGTVYFGTQNALLYAINPNGTLKWSFSLGAAAADGPSIGGDGTIFIPAGTRMYAINPNGTQKWVFDTTINANPAWGDPVYSSASIAPDGTIYFGSGIDVFAVTSSGVQKWQAQLNGDVYVAPVVGWDGTVYAFESGTEFVALNPGDGTRKWTQYTFSDHCGPALGSPSTIYVSGRNDPGYNIRSLNSAGQIVWQSYIGLTDFSSSLSLDASGVIYGGHLGGGISAVNPNGTAKWFAGYGDYSTPAVSSNGRIYLGDGDGFVYALQQSDGALLWTYPTGSAVYTSPALGVDGRLYVGTVDGRLLAFSGAGSPAASPWPQLARNQQRTGAADVPTVSISVPDGAAKEVPQDIGKFRISRTGSTGSSLVVNYTKSGTAICSPSFDYTLKIGGGADFCSIPITIPAGNQYVDVEVWPWGDFSAEGSETAILIISPSSAYTIGTPSSGTVTIFD